MRDVLDTLQRTQGQRVARLLLWGGLALILSGLSFLYTGYQDAISNVLNEIAFWSESERNENVKAYIFIGEWLFKLGVLSIILGSLVKALARPSREE